MGQKVSPIGMRVGVIRDWESRWYAEKDYADLLHEDIKLRELILTKCKDCNVSRVEIERGKNLVKLIIKTATPGRFQGEGSVLEPLKKEMNKIVKGKEIEIKLHEIANPNLEARLVALRIAKDLEERKSFRVSQKMAIRNVMKSGAKGIKTSVSGRLGGADIARSEGYSEGIVPLHTLRSDIDYAWEEAMTTYGKLGVKVWICRGEVKRGQMVKDQEKSNQPNKKFNKRPIRKAAPKTVKEGE